MRVAIIGQGYVGLTVAMEAAKAGHYVVGFDVNDELVELLKVGHSHIEGVSDIELRAFLGNGLYDVSASPFVLESAEVVVIAVPTPLDNDRNPDTSYLLAACTSIAENLNSPALIINESTSFPGTLRNLIAVSIASQSQTGMLQIGRAHV